MSAPISREEAARVRALSGNDRAYLERDRDRAGCTTLFDCAGCETGIFEGEFDDIDSNGHASHRAVNGSAIIDGDFLCADCAAKERSAA